VRFQAKMPTRYRKVSGDRKLFAWSRPQQGAVVPNSEPNLAARTTSGPAPNQLDQLEFAIGLFMKHVRNP
jgi:hypothetical protein